MCLLLSCVCSLIMGEKGLFVNYQKGFLIVTLNCTYTLLEGALKLFIIPLQDNTI